MRGRLIASLIVALALLLGACATMSPWTDARIESEVKARLVSATRREIGRASCRERV